MNNKTTQKPRKVWHTSHMAWMTKVAKIVRTAGHSVEGIVLAAKPGSLVQKSSPKVESECFDQLDLLLDQAKAALWLSVASEGWVRKIERASGPSRAADLSRMDAREMFSRRERLSEGCHAGDRGFQKRLAQSPSFGGAIGPIEVATPWKDVFFTLDQVGYSVQSFAQQRKHDLAKKGTRATRKIEAPTRVHFDLGRLSTSPTACIPGLDLPCPRR